jgi:MoxR-like ATPase
MYDVRALNELVAKESAFVDRLSNEVGKVIVGQQYMVERILVGLLTGGHVLLEGVPGLAKTLTVRTLCDAVHAKFARIQFTPDLLPADLVGTVVYNQQKGEFTSKLGPIFANLVLADEINRAPAKVQSALLEAMQERQVTIEGDRYELPNPFLVLATQNPIDLEGTYPLPEAQIDRFLVRVPMGYPTAREEAQMLRTFGNEPPVAKPVLTAPEVQQLQSICARIHVEDDLLDYAVGLAAFTRNHPRVALGASPRASLSLLQAAKGWALLGGRPFIAPDDVRAVAPSVLGHRLVLSADADQDARVRQHVVDEALAKVGYRRGVRAV